MWLPLMLDVGHLPSQLAHFDRLSSGGREGRAGTNFLAALCNKRDLFPAGRVCVKAKIELFGVELLPTVSMDSALTSAR